MAGVNKVIILGNLTKDVDCRFMPNGGAVSNLTVATSEKWKDKQTGEQKEKTEFHRVVIFGKLAEIAGEYLKKGSKAYFEGQLQTKKWQNKDGQDQYTTEVVVQGFSGVMQMLDGKQQGQQAAPAQQGQAQSGFQQAPQQGGYQNQQNPTYQQQAPAQQAAPNQQGWGQQQAQPAQQQPAPMSTEFDGDLPF